MVNKKAKGKRAKTRDKYKSRGKPTVNKQVRELEKGTTVHIVPNSAFHSALPHHRYTGRTGTVSKKRGFAYEILVRVGNTIKTLVTSPVHLKVKEK